MNIVHYIQLKYFKKVTVSSICIKSRQTLWVYDQVRFWCSGHLLKNFIRKQGKNIWSEMRGLILIRLILWEFMNHVTLTDLYHYTEGNSIQLFGSISHLHWTTMWMQIQWPWRLWWDPHTVFKGVFFLSCGFFSHYFTPTISFALS